MHCQIVDHVPYNLVPTFSMFLRGNKQRLRGSYHGKVNRGAGYGPVLNFIDSMDL